MFQDHDTKLNAVDIDSIGNNYKANLVQLILEEDTNESLINSELIVDGEFGVINKNEEDYASDDTNITIKRESNECLQDRVSDLLSYRLYCCQVRPVSTPPPYEVKCVCF